jgi:hypothetical protein
VRNFQAVLIPSDGNFIQNHKKGEAKEGLVLDAGHTENIKYASAIL